MEEKEDTIVKKSNILARGRWQATNVYEGRLLALVASKIHVDDRDFKSYNVTASELITDNPGGSTYHRMRNLADRLMTRVVTIEDGKSFAKYTLFCRCRFDGETSTLDMQIHPDLKSHYLDLNKYFTTYPLLEYLKLPSIYSQEIYELLRSFDDKAEQTIDIDYLHEKLNTKSEVRKNYYELDRRILKPALRHISEHTTLEYSYEPIKKGRKYTKVRFVFTKSKQALIAKKEEKKIRVKQKKVSQKNNDLVKRALECFEKNNNKCNKKIESEMCEFCRANLQ